MVWSCGMNGRSRESRPSASGGQTSKKNLSTQNQRTPHKPKASAEAIQMARILEDSTQASEVNSKVAFVLTVVPGCTEEQVHLALHDNNYDLDKTISALLDSDGVPSQGEWTTTTSSRKSRKKGTSTCTEEQSKANTGRTSSRSASSGTRENYGGSVSVGGGTGSGGGRMGQRQTSGRGRGQNAGKRVRSGAGVGEQRKTRQRDKDKSHSTTQGPAAPNKVSSEEWDSLPAATTTEQNEDWGREGDVWQQAMLTEQFWEPVEQPAESGLQLQPREASLERAQDTGLEQPRDSGLESAMLEEPGDFGEQGFEEGIDERNVESSIFPDAIPDGQALLHSTPSEVTPAALVNTAGTGKRGQALTYIPSESREKVISRKPRRLARSQIPTKPVEMPAGIESLDVQFGELGIDFVGLESGSPPPSEQASEGALSSLSVSASAVTAGDQLTTVDTQTQLTYSQLQQRYEESSVSMSTSSSSAGGGVGLGGGERALLQLEPSTFSEVAGGGVMVSTEDVASSGGVGGGGAGLRSPPGLPHPVVSATAPVVSAPKSSSEAQQQYGSNTATTGESSAATKDQTAGTGGMAVGGASSSQQSPGEAQLHLRSDVNPSPTLKATPIELPIELTTRQSQPASQQTTTTPGTIQHTPFSSVASSGSGKFSSSVTASTSVSSLSSSVTSRAVSGHAGSSLSSQHHQHHQTHQQQQQGKLGGNSVPPGMLYPHMMPAQYPFIPAVNPAAMYNYDPNDMSRYSSGSMAYFPTSTDPTMGGAIPSRDHTSSAFQAQTDQAKYAPPRGGASDLGSAVTVSANQQTQQQGGNLQQAAGAAASGAQQMGPAFMGTHHFYGSMFYPTMYGPMPAFSQAANFGAMSYEDMLAAAGGPASHDYSKMYAATGSSLSKQPSSTSTAPIDSSAALAAQASTSFKHHDTSKSFNYSVPGGVGASQAAPTAAPGYYMQMPFPPMMVGPGADVGGVAGGVAPHSRISQQKHNKGVGYQGNSGTSYWGSTAAHSS